MGGSCPARHAPSVFRGLLGGALWAAGAGGSGAEGLHLHQAAVASLPQPGMQSDTSHRHQLPLGTGCTAQKVLWQEFLGQVTLTWEPRGAQRSCGTPKEMLLPGELLLPLLSALSNSSQSQECIPGWHQLPLIHQLAQAAWQREADPSHLSRVGSPGSAVWLSGICLPNIPHQPADLKARGAAALL